MTPSPMAMGCDPWGLERHLDGMPSDMEASIRWRRSSESMSGCRKRGRTCDGRSRAIAEGETMGRSARKLTDHRRERIRRIPEEGPDVSNHRPAQQFEGIDGEASIGSAREGGLSSRHPC